MSNTTLINAVLALVEDRPKDAREILRSPGITVSSGALQSRLEKALTVREANAKIVALKAILRESLRIDTDIQVMSCREAFLLGISMVEAMIDDAIEELGA